MMNKQLFLTSSVHLVSQSISEKIKTRSGHMSTAYIATPTEKGCGDDLSWSDANRVSLQKVGFDTFDYTITGKDFAQITSDLKDIDVLYVEGGSLVHMLDKSRESGFDIWVEDFVKAGNPYIGTSTGSFIVAPNTEAGLPLEDYVRDKFDPKGFGLVNFLLMPHWGSEEFEKSYKNVPLEQYHTKTPMITLTDTQYVWVVGDQMQIIDVEM